MAFVGKGVVTQSADGTILTFTDQSSGIGTLVSRTLVITDSNNVVVSTTNMGATLTANQAITKDVFYTFTESIADNTGALPNVVVTYLSTAFYELIFAPLANKLSLCECVEKCLHLYKGEIAKSDAEQFALRNIATLAQSNIDAANLFLTQADCGC